MIDFRNKYNILIVGLVGLLVLIFLFNFLIDRYGAFWQKAASLSQGGIRCPSNQEFCQKSSSITRGSTYVGFGGSIAAGSPIYAAFDGTVTAAETTFPPDFGSEKIIAIFLDNKERGLRGVYYFKGELPTVTTAKAGDTIGQAGEPIAFYSNASLVFRLIEGDPVKGTPVNLSPQSFSK